MDLEKNVESPKELEDGDLLSAGISGPQLYNSADRCPSFIDYHIIWNIES